MWQIPKAPSMPAYPNLWSQYLDWGISSIQTQLLPFPPLPEEILPFLKDVAHGLFHPSPLPYEGEYPLPRAPRAVLLLWHYLPWIELWVKWDSAKGCPNNGLNVPASISNTEWVVIMDAIKAERIKVILNGIYARKLMKHYNVTLLNMYLQSTMLGPCTWYYPTYSSYSMNT